MTNGGAQGAPARGPRALRTGPGGRGRPVVAELAKLRAPAALTPLCAAQRPRGGGRLTDVQYSSRIFTNFVKM